MPKEISLTVEVAITLNRNLKTKEIKELQIIVGRYLKGYTESHLSDVWCKDRRLLDAVKSEVHVNYF